MRTISKEVIVEIHDQAVLRYGGALGVRDDGLLESQSVMPYQTFGGQELFPTLYDKAVRYLFGFATNQIFIDGNKRTAAALMLFFLEINDIKISITSDELEQMVLLVANKRIDEETVKLFLAKRTI